MIDVETDVFNAVCKAILAKFPNAFVVGDYTPVPSAFPCVSLVEMDNATLERTQSSASREHHARVMYELNVYSNKADTKKSECRSIAAVADGAMQDLGFTRTMLNPLPNMNDASIYRITGRYQAAVSENKTIFRR